MTWIHAAGGALGAMLGVLHSAGIWRTARRPAAMTAILGMVRLCTVGLALAAAAMLGVILPVAMGWAIGFFAALAAVLTVRRSGERRAAP
jgi:hypothetical protein